MEDPLTTRNEAASQRLLGGHGDRNAVSARFIDSQILPFKSTNFTMQGSWYGVQVGEDLGYTCSVCLRMCAIFVIL